MPFSDEEIRVKSDKLSLQISGGADQAPGKKFWYNEEHPWSPIVVPDNIWSDFATIPPATTPAQADANAIANPTIIERLETRLTNNPTSNNRQYEARQTYGDRTSDIYVNWIQPALVRDSGAPSNGYIIRLYNGDPSGGGVELPTTWNGGPDGAPSWEWNYSTGVLKVSTDQSANYGAIDAGAGLWVQGFRYIGPTGGGASTVASTPKRLGAIDIDGAVNLVNTDYVLYTVPAGSYALSAFVVVCNRNAALATTVRIAHSVAGPLNNEDYIFYDVDVLAYESKFISIPGMSAGDYITVRADTSDTDFMIRGFEDVGTAPVQRIAALATDIGTRNTDLQAYLSTQDSSDVKYYICNHNGALATRVRVAHIDDVVVGSLLPEDYELYEEELVATESRGYCTGLQMSANQTLMFRADEADVNIVVYCSFGGTGGGGGGGVSLWQEIGTDLSPLTPGNNVTVPGARLTLGDDVDPQFFESITQASGQATQVGDSQYERVVCYGETFDAAWTVLYPGGNAANNLTLVAGSSYTCRVLVTGVQYGGILGSQYDTWAYELIGNIVLAGGVTTMHSYISNTIFEADNTFDVQLVADDINDAIQVQVRGGVSKSVRWTAVVELINSYGG